MGPDSNPLRRHAPPPPALSCSQPSPTWQGEEDQVQDPIRQGLVLTAVGSSVVQHREQQETMKQSRGNRSFTGVGGLLPGPPPHGAPAPSGGVVGTIYHWQTPPPSPQFSGRIRPTLLICSAQSLFPRPPSVRAAAHNSVACAVWMICSV